MDVVQHRIQHLRCVDSGILRVSGWKTSRIQLNNDPQCDSTTVLLNRTKHNPIQCNNNPVHKFCDRDIDSFQQNSAPLKKLGNIQRN